MPFSFNKDDLESTELPVGVYSLTILMRDSDYRIEQSAVIDLVLWHGEELNAVTYTDLRGEVNEVIFPTPPAALHFKLSTEDSVEDFWREVERRRKSHY